MDTRVWGPDAWRLLHLIATSPYAAKSKPFWDMLPFVLPCKFCRASLTEYYNVLPVPSKQEEFAEWLYKIHNLVNQKLRDQGQSVPPDPPFKDVLERYEQLLSLGCSKTEFAGWTFLFCIADNHPSSSPSKPMPDAPEVVPKTLVERNRYNLLTPAERKRTLQTFWNSIPDVLPFKEWQDSWNQHASSVKAAMKDRKSCLRWLWKIRCGIESDLHQMKSTTFYGLCKKIASYRSGCSKSLRAKTCRRTQKAGSRKTRSNKQR
jgi:hypothetical protein